MPDCAKTTLPSETCSHCTGSVDLVEEPFYEVGQVIMTREERDEEIDRQEESNSTIAEVHKTPGKWAKAQDVYGGHDTQVDFEDIERTDEDG